MQNKESSTQRDLQEQVRDSLPIVLLKICFEYAKEPFGVIDWQYAPTYSLENQSSSLLTDSTQTRLFSYDEDMFGTITIRDSGAHKLVVEYDDHQGTGIWRGSEPCLPISNAFLMLRPTENGEVTIYEIDGTIFKTTTLVLPAVFS